MTGDCDVCDAQNVPLEDVNANPAHLGLEPTPPGEPDVVGMRLCTDCAMAAKEANSRLRDDGPDHEFDFTGGGV